MGGEPTTTLVDWLAFGVAAASLLTASISAVIAFLSRQAAKRSADAAERSANAAEASTQIHAAEAARKPEVKVEIVSLSPPELEYAGGKRALTVRLSNSGDVKATKARGWLALPADHFAPVHADSTKSGASDLIIYPTTEVPRDGYWIAEVLVSEGTLPPRSEQVFVIPTLVIQTGQALIRHQATCEEAPGSSGNTFLDVQT